MGSIIGPGSVVSSHTEVDDGTVAAGHTVDEALGLPYAFDGTDWRRQQARTIPGLPGTAGFDPTIFGLLVNARLGAIDERSGSYASLSCVSDTPELQETLLTTPRRESGFGAMIVGRRFYVTHQTVGSVVTGQTSFVATTPTFLITGGGVSRTLLRSITLSQIGTLAGAPISIAIMIDSVGRFSAGGTIVTAQNGNMESATAYGGTFRFNPTATAATGTQRVVSQVPAPASLGFVTQIDLKDGVEIGVSGSILVYTFAATTAPSWYFIFDLEQI